MEPEAWTALQLHQDKEQVHDVGLGMMLGGFFAAGIAGGLMLIFPETWIIGLVVLLVAVVVMCIGVWEWAQAQRWLRTVVTSSPTLPSPPSSDEGETPDETLARLMSPIRVTATGSTSVSTPGGSASATTTSASGSTTRSSSFHTRVLNPSETVVNLRCGAENETMTVVEAIAGTPSNQTGCGVDVRRTLQGHVTNGNTINAPGLASALSTPWRDWLALGPGTDLRCNYNRLAVSYACSTQPGTDRFWSFNELGQWNVGGEKKREQDSLTVSCPAGQQMVIEGARWGDPTSQNAQCDRDVRAQTQALVDASPDRRGFTVEGTNPATALGFTEDVCPNRVKRFMGAWSCVTPTPPLPPPSRPTAVCQNVPSSFS